MVQPGSGGGVLHSSPKNDCVGGYGGGDERDPLCKKKKTKRCDEAPLIWKRKERGCIYSYVFPLHRKFGCDSRHVVVNI